MKLQFSDYAGARNGNSALNKTQASAFAIQEVGQRWDFMITLRLCNLKATKFWQPTQCFNSLKLCIDNYLGKLKGQTIQVNGKPQTIYRSVYIHSDANGYHAHIYMKYPKRCNRNEWQKRLKHTWFRQDLLAGADFTTSINYDITHVKKQTFNFGVYGIKGNNEQTAWLWDSSVYLKKWDKAYKEGAKRLSNTPTESVPAPKTFFNKG